MFVMKDCLGCAHPSEMIINFNKDKRWPTTMNKTNSGFHNSIFFRCEEFLRSREHIDLDVSPAQLWEHQWEQFLTEYYSIIQGGAKIQVNTFFCNHFLLKFKAEVNCRKENIIILNHRCVSIFLFAIWWWLLWNLCH